MKLTWRKLVGATAGFVMLVGLAAAGPASGGTGTTTCFGGSIGSGTFGNIVIAGECSFESGNATTKNITVAPGGSLYAVDGNSNLTVNGNVVVNTGGVLILGCEPEAFSCFDDEEATTNDVIHGNLDAHAALAVIAHANTITGNLTLNNGGGGYNCDNQIFGGESPAYAAFEDNTIGGNATLTGWTSCWLGFFRNTVRHNVTFNNNSTADPDGNEVATNTIGGNLSCSGNSPAPQIGDSGGALNSVFGKTTGQCVGLVP